MKLCRANLHRVKLGRGNPIGDRNKRRESPHQDQQSRAAFHRWSLFCMEDDTEMTERGYSGSNGAAGTESKSANSELRLVEILDWSSAARRLTKWDTLPLSSPFIKIIQRQPKCLY